MQDDSLSLGGDATFVGSARRPRADVSLGDERTLGDGRSEQDTVIDDIEIVDLDARYRIEGTLGQGGMGAVLLATDTRLDRKVAIKRILGEAAGNRMAVQRFLTEAKAIAALNHPNIVQIYDYGRAKDGPFLIMEYVDGGSLLDQCRESALPLEEAIDLACQLCDGLAKAHDLGIIHRDIKPANVLLTADGMPKLTDFGLAKAEASDHGQTMTGAVLGTPDFMSPEQRRDASLVDYRSDLWSLAATIYQMVTGRSPKIIRFKDVPESIQEVLGKALEDRKDSRYQTARELRDALKTSLLARASAAVSDVLEGKCPACGVQNDPSRKFCRGCGESLEAACLACDMPMPMWEEICGSCGGKQTALIDDRRRTMAARQAEAEGLLSDFEFDRAIGIATLLRDEAHPRLKYLADWAVSFLEQIEKSRAEQTRHAVEAMAEAGKHVAQYDYLSAIFVLEMVPNSLRAGVLPGMRESAGAMLGRIKKTQGEASSLEARIKERLTAKQLDELLPDVEKLATLRPDRKDLQKIRAQLIDRQQKQAGARDTAIELAKASLASHDYEAALAVVAGVAPAMITPEVIALREQAESLVRQVRELAGKINAAVTAKQFDRLLDVVQKYLTLKPADLEVGKLRQSLVEREEKYAADIAAHLQQAEQLEQACRFDDAMKLLMAIPKRRRTKRVAACLGRVSQLGPMRRAVLESLANAKSGGYAAAIKSSRMYSASIADAGIADEEFAALLSKAEAAQAHEERTWKILKRTGIAVAAVVAVVVLTVAGIWIRSSARAAALATALQKGNWNDALQLDPENVAALVGRARGKLGTTPPDIEGAFADVDQANRTGREVAAVKAAKGDAHAARAREHAEGGKLDAAAQDLAEAQLGPASGEWTDKAKVAIAGAWLRRAEEAGRKGDGKRLQQALLSAKAAGALDQSFLPVWEEYGRTRVETLDVSGLELACAEGRKCGLSQVQQAAWWLMVGELGVEKGDEGAVRAGADNWQALGLHPDADKSAAGLWKLWATACLNRFDAKGLAIACTEGGKHGMPPTDIADSWLRFADLASKPPREDAAAVLAAVKAARAAGASDGAVGPLLLRGLIIEANALARRQQGEDAAAKFLEASSIDATAAIARLHEPTSRVLRQAVLDDYRKKYEAALSGKDWDDALQIVAEAEKLDATVPDWVSASVAKQPAGLSAVPPNALMNVLKLMSGTASGRETILKMPTVRNSIGIELKLLPAGTFTMGQAGFGANVTPHEVTMTKPFYLAVHELTNAQWRRVMDWEPTHAGGDDDPDVIRRREGSRPVTGMRWESAVKFCQKLSELPEERKAGRKYRLPTEAEWEYACRAGTRTEYSFGNDASQLGEYAWFAADSLDDGPYPVGKKKPNPWGLFDMHGNVQEWCNDWFADYKRMGATDPQGPAAGESRTCRGGSYWSHASWCRSGCRNEHSSDMCYLGFRVAISVPEVNVQD